MWLTYDIRKGYFCKLKRIRMLDSQTTKSTACGQWIRI